MIPPSNTQIIRKVAEMYFKIGKGGAGSKKKSHAYKYVYIFLKSSFLLFEPFLLCKGIFKLSTEYNHFESIPWAKNSVHCRTYAACILRSEQKSKKFCFFGNLAFQKL